MLAAFSTWHKSFHGVKSIEVLQSVLTNGGLAKPGDRLINGSILTQTKGHAHQGITSSKLDGSGGAVYTSPTIKYQLCIHIFSLLISVFRY